MGKNREIINFISLIIGCMLIALTFTVLCVPHNYVIGGISGIGVVFNYLFNLKVSYILVIGNIVVTIVGILSLGLKDIYRSIIGSIVYTICVYLSELIAPYIAIEFSSVFLNIVVSGGLMGLGCACVYLANYTTGGVDILGLIMHKKMGMTFGRASLIINMLILMLGAFIFGVEMFVIALVIRYIESYIIDTFLIGISDSKVLFINTKEVSKVKDYIIGELKSGVSEIKVNSGFLRKEGKLIMCVVPTEKYLFLKNEIIKIDKDAFITILDAYEVYGGTNKYKLPFHDLRL